LPALLSHQPLDAFAADENAVAAQVTKKAWTAAIAVIAAVLFVRVDESRRPVVDQQRLLESLQAGIPYLADPSWKRTIRADVAAPNAIAQEYEKSEVGSFVTVRVSIDEKALAAKLRFLNENRRSNLSRDFPGLLKHVDAPGLQADDVALFCANIQRSKTAEYERLPLGLLL
jgi:hypothetical protein